MSGDFGDLLLLKWQELGPLSVLACLIAVDADLDT